MEPARLEVVQEGRRQEVDLNKGTFTIGRASDNDLVLVDHAVSKYHARLLYSNRGWKVSDLGSANGTYVNGERLFTLDSRVLENGSSIRIGGVYIVLRVQQPGSEDPGALDDPALSEEMERLLQTAGSNTPASEAGSTDRLLLANEIWHLQVALTDGQQQEVALNTTPFSIGRSRDAGLPLTDAMVSKSHAQLRYSRGVWQLSDVGSANGTQVDGEQLQPNAERILADGTRIQIGNTQIVIRRYVWQLVLTQRGGRRQEVELSRSPFKIGRASDNELSLNDAAVSDHHAELAFENNEWRLTDLESEQGTLVDMARLQAFYPRPITPSSNIQIGSTQIALTLGPPKVARTQEQAEPGRRSAVLDSIFDDLSGDTKAARRTGQADDQPATPAEPEPTTLVPIMPAPATPASPTARLAQPEADERESEREPEAPARSRIDDFKDQVSDLPVFEQRVSIPLRHASERLLQSTGFHSVRYWLRNTLGINLPTPGRIDLDAPPKDEPLPRRQQPKPAPKPVAELVAHTPILPLAPSLPARTSRVSEGALVDGDLPVIEESKHIYLVPTSGELVVNAGQAVTIAVSVMNRAQVVDRISIMVAGVPAHWVTVTPASLPLLPENRGEIQIVITPPRDPSSLAGLHHFAIIGRSEELAGEQTVLGATLTIMPYSEFRLNLRPRQQGAWRKTAYRTELVNLGNHTEAFQLRGYDDEELLEFTFDPEQPVIPPGRTRNVEAQVRTRSWLWFGMPKTLFFTINAAPVVPALPPHEAVLVPSVPTPPQDTQGRFIHQSIFSIPLIIIMIALLLMLIAPFIIKYWMSAFAVEPTPTVVPVLAGLTLPLTPTATLELPTVALPTLEPPTATLEPTPIPPPTAQPVTQPPVVTPIPQPTSAPVPTREPPPPPTAGPPTATPTPENEITCIAGQPVVLSGIGPPRAPILLFFDQRAVGGGNVDPDGRFALTLRIGEEAPGEYPVTVQERASHRVLLQRTCIVPRP